MAGALSNDYPPRRMRAMVPPGRATVALLRFSVALGRVVLYMYGNF